jgi:hypothetical protein
MSVSKSNNMGGAYGNKKKENELLKAENLVLKSNQNGIRLKLNETGDCVFSVSFQVSNGISSTRGGGRGGTHNASS